MKTQFDEIGRIQLSSDAMMDLGIAPEQNLQIRLDNMKLIFTLINEQRTSAQNEHERTERQRLLQELPVSQQIYVRAVDAYNRIVLPIAFRKKLGWTTDTVLELEHNESRIYLYEVN